MMDVDEPSAAGRAARSQEASNVLGMLICATTDSINQSKHASLHHGLFGLTRAVPTNNTLHMHARPQHVQ